MPATAAAWDDRKVRQPGISVNAAAMDVRYCGSQGCPLLRQPGMTVRCGSLACPFFSSLTVPEEKD